MSRIILAHLNITLPEEDLRTAAQVQEVLEGVIEVGVEGMDADESIIPFSIVITSVEEL